MRKRATYTHGGEREKFHFSPNLDMTIFMSKFGHIWIYKYKEQTRK